MNRILLFLAEGFEELEVVAPIDIWRRAGFEVTLASIHEHKLLTSSRGIKIEADVLLSEVLTSQFDAIFLPGGREGVMNLALDSRVAQIAKDYVAADKWVIAICAAPVVLERAGLLSEKQITSFWGVKDELVGRVGAYLEDPVVVDGKLITSRAAGTSHLVGLEVVKQILGSDKADQIAKVMLFAS